MPTITARMLRTTGFRAPPGIGRRGGTPRDTGSYSQRVITTFLSV
jgi:hypothetical protein